MTADHPPPLWPWSDHAQPPLASGCQARVCGHLPLTHSTLTPDTWSPSWIWQAMESEFRDVCEQEKAEVVGLGGLHVIGTERHESRRIDNQLRGRCGRCSACLAAAAAAAAFTCVDNGSDGQLQLQLCQLLITLWE